MGYFKKGRWVEEFPIPNREIYFEFAAMAHKWGRERGQFIKIDLKGTNYEHDRVTQYGVFQMIKFMDFGVKRE